MENKNIIGLRLHFCKLKYNNTFYTNQCPNLDDYIIVDCSSRNKELAHDLSPFYLGPAVGPDGASATTIETFYQCGKVYPCHDDNGKPNEEYFKWRNKMYNKKIGELSKEELRHPEHILGFESHESLYFPWYDVEKNEYNPLDYVAARKKVYIPNYARLVSKTKTFNWLKSLLAENKKIALADFDTYNYYDDKAMYKKYESYVNKCKKNHIKPTLKYEDFNNIKTMKDVINCPYVPAGHAFVIKALLQGDIEVLDNGDVIDHSGILS